MTDRDEREREAARLERERRRLAEQETAAAAAEPEPESTSEPEPPPTAQFRPAADVPIGTVRPGAAHPGRTAQAPPAGGAVARRRRPALIAALLALLAVLIFLWFSIFTPFKGEGSGAVVVRIPEGSGARQVGDLLAAKGVVSSGFFFSLRATISGDRDKLRAGRFTLRKGMSNGAALAALTAPPQTVTLRTLKITLPEGPGRRELAPKVKAAGVSGDYVAASRRSDVLNPRRYGAPKRTPSLEGFLFPATYDLPLPATAQRLVEDQLKAFRRAFATVDLTYARKKNLTAYDVLIIASMIERETAVPAERRRVASVIYNRLRDGIALGIDATTRYAYDNWARPLRVSEIESDNPYNTRRRLGLPPTPIGNPGLASITAAANPERTGFLYYVVKPCGEGAHAFSKTDAEFQRDVEAYNRKRAALGGKDPSTCPKR
ncbi:unannotated protein [freshwater metagenome]|uniref:Unannotated protein n=1 Tax=freshwater metagenome TaxID=449393 RepID=A0A6J7HXR4_9ZZZZ|nr:endolytic transglycosylase MltG [Actinomycetota bacterium]